MVSDEQAHGVGDRPFFRVALNLPHAGRIARRIVLLLPARGAPGGAEAAAARKVAVRTPGRSSARSDRPRPIAGSP
jgi:hypothetical protein